MSVPTLEMIPRTFAHDHARPRTFAICPMRCALRIGLDGGRLGGDLCRCAVGIGKEDVVCVALCRCDWREGRPVGSAVPLKLVGRASCG